jgi:hypothetical protein
MLCNWWNHIGNPPTFQPQDEGVLRNTVPGTLEFDDKCAVPLPGYVFCEWKDGSYSQTDAM